MRETSTQASNLHVGDVITGTGCVVKTERRANYTVVTTKATIHHMTRTVVRTYRDGYKVQVAR